MTLAGVAIACEAAHCVIRRNRYETLVALARALVRRTLGAARSLCILGAGGVGVTGFCFERMCSSNNVGKRGLR